jgi:hypothetical protein
LLVLPHPSLLQQSESRAYVGGHEGAAKDSIEAGAPTVRAE